MFAARLRHAFRRPLSTVVDLIIVLPPGDDSDEVLRTDPASSSVQGFGALAASSEGDSFLNSHLRCKTVESSS